MSIIQQCSKKTDPVFAVLFKKIRDLVVHHSTTHRAYSIHPLCLVVRKEDVRVTDYTPVIQCSYTPHCWCAAQHLMLRLLTATSREPFQMSTSMGLHSRLMFSQSLNRAGVSCFLCQIEQPLPHYLKFLQKQNLRMYSCFRTGNILWVSNLGLHFPVMLDFSGEINTDAIQHDQNTPL